MSNDTLKIEDKHVIAILVDNEFGALARVVSLFSARGYNIETLSVAVVDEVKNISRITITTYGSQNTIDLIIKLLERLVPVHKAIDLSDSMPHIERSLVLVKVKLTEETREEIIRIGNIHNAKLVDKEKNYFMLQVSDKPSRIKNFIDLLEPFGVMETSYTGSAALSLGLEKL